MPLCVLLLRQNKKQLWKKKTKAGKTIHFATVFIHVTETIKKILEKKFLFNQRFDGFPFFLAKQKLIDPIR